MTNNSYVEFKKFDQSEMDSRFAHVESIYETYSPDPTSAGAANAYKEYCPEYLPEGVDYRTLPGAMEHFIMYNDLEGAFKAHAKAVKEGYTDFTGALITQSIGLGTRVAWQMTKPNKQRKEDLAQLRELVKQRLESDNRQYNIAETQRQVEFKLAELELQKQRDEEAKAQAARDKVIAELMETYQ